MTLRKHGLKDGTGWGSRNVFVWNAESQAEETNPGKVQEDLHFSPAVLKPVQSRGESCWGTRFCLRTMDIFHIRGGKSE